MRSATRLSEILNIKNKEIDIKSNLDKWYVTLLNKTMEEVDIKDISRMLRQDILIDLAVNKAVEILKENPLAGEMYDGQLLEILYSVDVNKYKETDKVKDILIKINSNISSFERMSDEDLKDYLVVLEKFLKKLD